MKYLYIISLCLIFISCNKDDYLKSPELEKVEKFILNKPDSALEVLNSIETNFIDEYNNNLYLLLMIQCRSMNDKDISKDTDIVNVYDYFKERGDTYYTTIACFLCGQVMCANKEYNQALNYYNVAESYAVANNQEYIQGLILYSKSELLLNQLLIDQANSELNKANKIFKKTGNYQYEIKGYNDIAYSFLLKQEYDSSLYYYNKAYKVAELYSDKKEMAYSIKDQGLLYMDQGNYSTSIKLVNEAKLIDSIIIKSGKADLILSNAYFELGKIDSARYFANMSLYWVKKSKTDSTEMFSTIYKYTSSLEKYSGNYRAAYENLELYNKYLVQYITDNMGDALIDAEKKYKYEVVQNEITNLSIDKMKKERIILILSLVIVLFGGVYYYFITKKKKQLNLANSEILNLTATLTSFRESKETMVEEHQNIVEKHQNIVEEYENQAKGYYENIFKILKRAASLEYFVKNTGDKQDNYVMKKFNEIAYGCEKIDWTTLYNIITNTFDYSFEKIKEKYPQLDESDFRISCMTIVKMNSNEIAVVMQLSVNTVHMKTTQIRKKLGVEKYGNLADFFINNLK